jgi:hypothetical protein
MVLCRPIGICACCCRCFRMGPLFSQQVLPMASFGPIGIYACCFQCFRMGPLAYAPAAVDDFAWAYYFSNRSCRWTGMGPLAICPLLLLMASYASIIFLRCAADSLGWAHWYMLQACSNCRWYRLGPLFSQDVLLMRYEEPIDICAYCCRWLRLGPLFFRNVLPVHLERLIVVSCWPATTSTHCLHGPRCFAKIIQNRYKSFVVLQIKPSIFHCNFIDPRG